MASMRRTILRAANRSGSKYLEVKYSGNRKERRAKKHKANNK